MSGDYPFPAKIVSPAKCNEKPWDSWIGEIGRLSPRPDDEPFAAPAEAKGGASRRVHDALPYKRGARYRRAGLHRLRHDSMSLHGLFPQMDNLNAAVCHMCGAVVKCSAAYRHLAQAHAGAEPLPPPPPPAKSRSRHKKEQLPPSPVDPLPGKREPSPALVAAPPLARIALPQQELQYMEEPSPAPVTGEVQVCVESGELPVVSIQDTEELPLGENLTDDIFAIMNSEGIQSADDIANSADWKNIIRDIGNLQDLNFAQPAEPAAAELYAPALHTPLSTYAIPESELAHLQFAASTPPLPALDAAVLPAAAHRPAPAAAPAPAARPSARAKSAKTKFNLREYDPNKHCGVVTAENPKPCTRSLTCKAHALSLRRLVEGRAKSFDALLAEHRASRDANASAAAAPPPPPPAPAPAPLPPLLVAPALDLSAFNGLTAEQQVDDIYASLLSVEEPVLPDTSSITSLLSQPMELAAPEQAEAARVPPAGAPSPERAPREEAPARPAPADVCWYAACPRPLALCTYNASHAGGAVALGKRYATVRSNIKSSLSRSCKTAGASNDFYYGPNALALSKSVHMNASKSNKPEVRKLIVTCSEGRGGGSIGGSEARHALSELLSGDVRHALSGDVRHALSGDVRHALSGDVRHALSGDVRHALSGDVRHALSGDVRHALNGHVSKARTLKHAKAGSSLELAFLDPLLADDKC